MQMCFENLFTGVKFTTFSKFIHLSQEPPFHRVSYRTSVLWKVFYKILRLQLCSIASHCSTIDWRSHFHDFIHLLSPLIFNYKILSLSSKPFQCLQSPCHNSLFSFLCSNKISQYQCPHHYHKLLEGSGALSRGLELEAMWPGIEV